MLRCCEPRSTIASISSADATTCSYAWNAHVPSNPLHAPLVVTASAAVARERSSATAHCKVHARLQCEVTVCAPACVGEACREAFDVDRAIEPLVDRRAVTA